MTEGTAPAGERTVLGAMGTPRRGAPGVRQTDDLREDRIPLSRWVTFTVTEKGPNSSTNCRR